ncbi:PXA domain-containing protein [Paraphysoderma sedebokerense]|nr:PXA domain-containing protein [Paraphysoderma sedebokerense]
MIPNLTTSSTPRKKSTTNPILRSYFPLDTPQPRLTSNQDVDSQLYITISYLIRDYIKNWYSEVTADGDLMRELIGLIANVSTQLESRLKKIDYPTLLLIDIPLLLTHHHKSYKYTESLQKVYRPHPPRQSTSSIPPSSALFNYTHPHFALDSPDKLRQYLTALSEEIIKILMPRNEVRSETVKLILRDLLSCTVFENLLKMCSDPENVNRWLIQLLSSMTCTSLQSKTIAKEPPKSSSTLSTTLSPPPEPSSTEKKTPRHSKNVFTESQLTGIPQLPSHRSLSITNVVSTSKSVLRSTVKTITKLQSLIIVNVKACYNLTYYTLKSFTQSHYSFSPSSSSSSFPGLRSKTRVEERSDEVGGDSFCRSEMYEPLLELVNELLQISSDPRTAWIWNGWEVLVKPVVKFFGGHIIDRVLVTYIHTALSSQRIPGYLSRINNALYPPTSTKPSSEQNCINNATLRPHHSKPSISSFPSTSSPSPPEAQFDQLCSLLQSLLPSIPYILPPDHTERAVTMLVQLWQDPHRNLHFNVLLLDLLVNHIFPELVVPEKKKVQGVEGIWILLNDSDKDSENGNGNKKRIEMVKTRHKKSSSVGSGSLGLSMTTRELKSVSGVAGKSKRMSQDTLPGLISVTSRSSTSSSSLSTGKNSQILSPSSSQSRFTNDGDTQNDSLGHRRAGSLGSSVVIGYSPSRSTGNPLGHAATVTGERGVREKSHEGEGVGKSKGKESGTMEQSQSDTEGVVGFGMGKDKSVGNGSGNVSQRKSRTSTSSDTVFWSSFTPVSSSTSPSRVPPTTGVATPVGEYTRSRATSHPVPVTNTLSSAVAAAAPSVGMTRLNVTVAGGVSGKAEKSKKDR